MTNNKFLHKELTYKIQGIILDARKIYGFGQKESIYQEAFAEELRNSKVPFKKEADIQIFSQKTGKMLGSYRPDFIIDDKIILEIKAIKFSPKKSGNQPFDYLKRGKYEFGLMVNFGGFKLYRRRIIFTNDRKPWLHL